VSVTGAVQWPPASVAIVAIVVDRPRPVIVLISIGAAATGPLELAQGAAEHHGRCR
jgi:hypothetical protein